MAEKTFRSSAAFRRLIELLRVSHSAREVAERELDWSSCSGASC